MQTVVRSAFQSDEDPVPYSSILQFSLRRSLAGLAVLSVVFAVTVPAIRALPPERQQVVFVFLSTVIGTLLVAIGSMAWMRYQAQAKCGRILHVVIPHYPRGARWLPVMMFFNAGTMLMLAWSSTGQTLTPRPASGTHLLLRLCLQLLFPALAGIHLTPAILRLWCGQRVVGIELCEHGIVGGVSFSPWSAIRRFHWNASGLLVVQYRFSRQELPVDPADHDIVDQIFGDHVGTKAEGCQLQ